MSNKEAIRQLIVLFKPYKKKLFIIIFILLISCIIALITPLVSRNLMDNGFLKSNHSVVISSALFMLLLVGIDKIFNYIKEYVRTILKANIIYSLYEKAFQHLEKLKISELNKTNNTELLNNISSDVSTISMVSDSVFFVMLTQIFNIIGGIIGLFIINKKLTLLVLLFIPVKYLIVSKFTKIRKKLMIENMKSHSAFAGWFGDMMGGIKEIKIYDIFHHKNSEFEQMQKKIVDIEKKMTLQDSVNTAADQVILQILVTALYIIGANMVMNLQLTVGSVLTFIAYCVYVINPISSLLNLGMILSNIVPAVTRYQEFMNLETEYKEDSVSSKEFTKQMKMKPSFQFNNVYFSYNDKGNTLENIDFVIDAGKKLAIIGLNGSGKTTIINLLLRFYRPNQGVITLNQTDISKISISEYRKNISIVSQDSYLFDETIKHNICLYKEITEETFVKALKDSNLYEFYCSLPIEFKIGANGCFLSSGQRQKVLIARALITGNNFIILDEATANIDVDTENQINELILTTLKDKTMLIISHKPGILKYMDEIIVLENGKIAGIGNHEQLFRHSKIYKDIINKEGFPS